MLYSFLSCSAKIFLKIFFRLKIEGIENIPSKEPCIIVSNHISFLDPVVIAAVCFRKINFLARASLFKNYFFAKLLRSINVIPLVRDSSDFKALRQVLNKLRENKVVALFPQGTRGGGWQKIKGGAEFLAQQANAPIIPAYIKGTDIALPRGAKLIRFCPIVVYFGKRILPAEFTPLEKSKQDIAGRSTKGINAEIIKRIEELRELSMITAQ